MIETRFSVFKREGRKGLWKKLKKITDTMIENRKRKYYNKEVAKLSEDGSHRLPYKVLKNIADTERPPPWSVESLAENGNIEKLADDLAVYFSSIAQEFPDLDRAKITRTFDRPIHPVTTQEVAMRLCSMKKPKSSVRIDPLTRFLSPLSMKWAEA